MTQTLKPSTWTRKQAKKEMDVELSEKYGLLKLEEQTINSKTTETGDCFVISNLEEYIQDILEAAQFDKMDEEERDLVCRFSRWTCDAWAQVYGRGKKKFTIFGLKIFSLRNKKMCSPLDIRIFAIWEGNDCQHNFDLVLPYIEVFSLFFKYFIIILLLN